MEETADKDDATKLKCSECGKRIDYGGDLLTVEKCVLGPRGIVELGEKLLFCSEKCLRSYYSDTDVSQLPKMPPRIP